MKTNFFTILIVSILAVNFLSAQVLLEGTLNNGINVIILPCDEDIPLIPQIRLPIANISHYNVSSIPYEPLVPFDIPYETNIFTNDNDDDDVFYFVNLPFNFTFYENVYNTLNISANGSLYFARQHPAQPAPWNLGLNNFPTTNSPELMRNSIYGVFEDTDLRPSVMQGVGSVKYTTLGEEHYCMCGMSGRKFIVSYDSVPLYRTASNVRNTYQIVMYENTNIIDVYIKRRERYPLWNNGRGVIGVQNSTGTKATCPQGRNVTDEWSTVGIDGINRNEAWRFTPVAEPSATVAYTLTWYKGVGVGTADDIVWVGDTLLIPNDVYINDTLTLHLQYNYGGTYYNFYDTVAVRRANIFIYPQTIYEIQDTISDGDSYIFGNQVLTTEGFYTDTLKSINGCDSIVTLHLVVTGSNAIFDAQNYDLQIFPNPVTSELHIINNAQLIINNVEICDIAGRVVLGVFNTPLQGVATINVSHLPQGIYFIKIYTEKGVIVDKVVKK